MRMTPPDMRCLDSSPDMMRMTSTWGIAWTRSSDPRTLAQTVRFWGVSPFYHPCLRDTREMGQEMRGVETMGMVGGGSLHSRAANEYVFSTSTQYQQPAAVASVRHLTHAAVVVPLALPPGRMHKQDVEHLIKALDKDDNIISHLKYIISRLKWGMCILAVRSSPRNIRVPIVASSQIPPPP